MKEKEIDVRNVPTSCTSHPVMVLANALSYLAKEDIDVVKIYFNVSDIPENVVKFFLSKHRYSIEEIKVLDNNSRLIIAKKER